MVIDIGCYRPGMVKHALAGFIIWFALCGMGCSQDVSNPAGDRPTIPEGGEPAEKDNEKDPSLPLGESATSGASSKGLIGWEIYRQLDRLPYFAPGSQLNQFSS